MSESPRELTETDQVETLDRLDELVSLLLDDALDAESLAEIESLLAADAEARRRYLEFTQLHADLHLHYRPEAAKGESTPIPGFPIVDLSGGPAASQPTHDAPAG